MAHSRFYLMSIDRYGIFVVAFLLLLPAGAVAALKWLDRSLTNIKTKVEPKLDCQAESRSITIVFDEQAKESTVHSG